MYTQSWAPQATFHTPIHLQSREITDLSQRSGWRHFLLLLFPSCWPSPTPRELNSCSAHTEKMIPLLLDPPLLAPFIICSSHRVLVKGERALPPSQGLAYHTRDRRRHPMSLFNRNHVALRETATCSGMWSCKIQKCWCWTKIWLNEKGRIPELRIFVYVCVLLN